MLTAINLIYCLFFLQIFSPVLYQIKLKKESKFLLFDAINFCNLAILTIISYKILKNGDISRDFNGFLLEIDQNSVIFSVFSVFLTMIINIFYKKDIIKLISAKNSNLYLTLSSLNILLLTLIFFSNNILNLYILLEIFVIAFLSLFFVFGDKKINELLFNQYLLNLIFSLIFLFIIALIYLNFLSFDFNFISDEIMVNDDSFSLKILSFLLILIFLIKFISPYFYLKLTKINNKSVDFIIANNIFILSNLGLFLILKFSKLIFYNYEIVIFLLILSAIFIVLACYKLVFSYHLKIKTIYFIILQIALFFLCNILNNQISLRAAIYYFLNINLIGLFLLLFSDYLKRKFNSSKSELILRFLNENSQESKILLVSLQLILFLCLSLPFSFSFYSNYEIISALFIKQGILSFKYSYLLQYFILLFIFLAIFSSLIFSLKIIYQIFNSKNSENDEAQNSQIEVKKNKIYVSECYIFLFLLIVSYGLVFNPEIINKIYLVR